MKIRYWSRIAVFSAIPVLFPVASWAKDTGLIFVSNEKTNNIIVIDPKTFQIVNDIKVARRPRDMHFNQDHTKLYVACGDDDVIDIIDVAKLEVVGKLNTGPSPETFAMDEKRHRIYVSDEEGSRPALVWRHVDCPRAQRAAELAGASGRESPTGPAGR
jgi:hypothetical protein